LNWLDELSLIKPKIETRSVTLPNNKMKLFPSLLIPLILASSYSFNDSWQVTEALDPKPSLHESVESPVAEIALGLFTGRNLKNMVLTSSFPKPAKLDFATIANKIITFANSNDIKVDTVEINPDAKKNYDVLLIHSDAINFLQSYPRQIDLLFMNSAISYQVECMSVKVKALRELMAAYNKFHSDSIVLVEGCSDDSASDRCGLVEMYLKELGWESVFKAGHLLMVPSESSLLNTRE